jgi:hypothetical protein
MIRSQEVASDEGILPYRGGTDWFDGGKFIAVHQHLMTPGNSLVGDTWTQTTLTLARAVIAAERLKQEAANWEYKCPGWLLRNGSHEGIPQYVSLG